MRITSKYRNWSSLTLVWLHLIIIVIPMSTMLANSPLLSVCELNSNAQRIGFWYGYKIKSSLIKKYHSDLTQPRNTYIHRMIPSFFRWEYYIREISTKKPFSSRIRYCFMNCHIAWCRYKQSHQNTYNDLIWLRSNNRTFTWRWKQVLL